MSRRNRHLDGRCWLLLLPALTVGSLHAEEGRSAREQRAAELTRVVRDSVADDIAQLGGEKIGQIATRLEVTIPDQAYSCLCRTYPRSGHVGVKAEGGECHFSGLGSWTEPLPSGGAAWQGCLGASGSQEGADLFGAAIGEVAGATPQLGPSGGMRFEVKVMEYRRDCLPAPLHASAREYEAANMKQVGIYQALSQPMRVILRDTVYEKANAIAESEAERCNAAIASKLYMDGQDGQDGRFALDLVADAAWQTYRPQYVDYAEQLAQEYATWSHGPGPLDGTGAFIDLATSDPPLAAKAAGLHKYYADLSTKVSLLKTLRQEYETRARNAQRMAAYELFQATRDATPAAVGDIRAQLKQELTTEQANVARLMEERQKALRALYERHFDANNRAVALLMEKRAQQQRGAIVELTEAERKRVSDYEWARVKMEAGYRDRIGEIGTRIGTLMLKDQVLEEYRLPLARDGCVAFIEARRKAGRCPTSPAAASP